MHLIEGMEYCSKYDFYCTAQHVIYLIFRSADLPEHAFKVAMKELKVRYLHFFFFICRQFMYQQFDERQKLTTNATQPIQSLYAT